MNKTTIVFKSLLLILKNLTIVIPLIEGVVQSIYDFNHPKKEGEKNG